MLTRRIDYLLLSHIAGRPITRPGRDDFYNNVFYRINDVQLSVYK